jgi:hypothetical protein
MFRASYVLVGSIRLFIWVWNLVALIEETPRLGRFRGRTFGPERDEVTWEWKRSFSKELYALYSSPYIILVIK